MTLSPYSVLGLVSPSPSAEWRTVLANPQGKIFLYPRSCGCRRVTAWLSYRWAPGHQSPSSPEPPAIQAPAFHQGSNGLQAVLGWAWLVSGMISSPPTVAAGGQVSPGWRRGQHQLGQVCSLSSVLLHLHWAWKQSWVEFRFPKARPSALCWPILAPSLNVLVDRMHKGQHCSFKKGRQPEGQGLQNSSKVPILESD